ncbi:hypothetical protein ACJMK2_004581 [Sinanodonta woodiana]|uniref:Uncharacterized protein n=1 Tax=Sinanodonta woodiana TaxID=1069815 RepID=A0ABD3Y1M3_SINWO
MGSASSVEAHPKATSIVSAPQKIVVPAAMENEKKSQPEKKEEIVDGEKILTEEEVKIRKDVIFKALNETIDSVKQIPGLRTEDGQWNADLLKGLRVFSASYFSIKNIGSLPYDVIQKYRREAGQRLSESKSTSVMCKVIMDGWKRGYRTEEGKTDAHQLEGLSKSLLTLLNYSDCTPEVTYDIAGEPDFLETITGILTTILPKHMKGEAKSFGAIWVLAFEKENHRKILDDTKLNIIDLLVEFKEKSSDKEVRKAIDGTLWILREELQKNNKYKHIEAEYAFQLRKKIIPLKMERGYQPDGWLGFLIGAKLFYEFSGKYAFEAKIKELIREISSTYGNEDAEPKIVPVKSQREETMDTVDSAPVAVTMKPVYSAPPPPVAVVRKWTPSDVNRWIEKHNLPKKNFEKLTGRELALLVTMRLEAPEFFYNYLQKNLGISSLLTMAMFIEGLEDLST